MICDATVPFASTLLVLGVTLDSKCTFDEQITVVVHACNFHLCTLHPIWHLINTEAANTISCSIVCCHLDYCHSILYVVTEINIGDLQHVQVGWRG